MSRDRHHDKEANRGRHRHRVKTHLTDSNARLEEASILARRLAVIMVGVPVARTFTVISPTSYHGQWSGASFKISGVERQFLYQLVEDQKSKVSGSAPRYLYRRGKPKWSFKTHAWDSVRHARRLNPFATLAVQRPTHYE
jgi:hypothetical protein